MVASSVPALAGMGLSDWAGYSTDVAILTGERLFYLDSCTAVTDHDLGECAAPGWLDLLIVFSLSVATVLRVTFGRPEFAETDGCVHTDGGVRLVMLADSAVYVVSDEAAAAVLTALPDAD